MATSTEIKSNNNTLIRVKTTAKSITKANVADQLDAVVDYVVQEVKSKVLKRTILHSELLDIFTTPIILIPAVAGKMYDPKSILIKYINNDGWSSVGTWRVLLDATQLTNFGSQMGGSTTKEQFTYLIPGNPSNTTDSYFNKNVYITSSANPTTPVNPLTTVDVYITYNEITL